MCSNLLLCELREKMKIVDIYHQERVKEAALKKLHSSNISEENKKLILDFIAYKVDVDHIKISQEIKYIVKLRILAEHLNKDFDTATKPDIQQLLKEIFSMDVTYGSTETKLVDSGKNMYGKILKTFYKWLKKTDSPEETKWIKSIKVKVQCFSTNDVLTWNDVVFLSGYAMNTRDKALIQVLWESGVRIGELLTLQIGDIEILNQGLYMVLHLRESKTYTRGVLIVRSAPALTEWLNQHPLKKNKTSPLWVTMDSKSPLLPPAVRRTLQRAQANSDFKKPIYPHHFRHSSASYWGHHLTESELEHRMGWVHGSGTAKYYVNLNENTMNNKILAKEGLLHEAQKQQSEEDLENKPITCRWCSKLNPVGVEYCVTCKRPLDDSRGVFKRRIDDIIHDCLLEYMQGKPDVFSDFTVLVSKRLSEQKITL